MSNSPALKIGNGLIEVSALATLVGASSAEALTLGLKGAGGMAWATMSSFGSLYVVKAALSAVVPDWSRELLGLRGPHVDDAIGVAVSVETISRFSKRLAELGNLRAVMIGFTSHPTNQRIASILQRLGRHTRSGDVEDIGRIDEISIGKSPVSLYVLDKGTSSILDMIPATPPGNTLEINQFLPNNEAVVVHGNFATKDWITILLSAVKLIEVISLQRMGSEALWWVTGVPWLVSFSGAVLLHVCGVGRDDPNRSQCDIIAGTFPSPLSPGQERKLIVGIPANSRRHWAWLIIWAILPFVVISAIAASYLLLSSQSARVVYAWAAYQALWLLTRLIVYYVVEGVSDMSSSALPLRQNWEDASASSRRRTLRLLFAVCKQQITTHPRGAHAYRHDCTSAQALERLFSDVRWGLTERIPLIVSMPAATSGRNVSNLDIDVAAVIGDNILRTFAWADGVTIDDSDIYDAVLIFVRIHAALYAVPAARVWSCDCSDDISRRPRGNRHCSICPHAKWISWIPAAGGVDGSDRYVHLDGSKNLGKMRGDILTSAELHRRLREHGWKHISLMKVEEVESILRSSRVAAEALKNMLHTVQNG